MDLKIGDHVYILKPVARHISRLKRSGTIVGLMPPYCKVGIRYGGRTGCWCGPISDVSKTHREER